MHESVPEPVPAAGSGRRDAAAVATADVGSDLNAAAVAWVVGQERVGEEEEVEVLAELVVKMMRSGSRCGLNCYTASSYYS